MSRSRMSQHVLRAHNRTINLSVQVLNNKTQLSKHSVASRYGCGSSCCSCRSSARLLVATPKRVDIRMYNNPIFRQRALILVHSHRVIIMAKIGGVVG